MKKWIVRVAVVAALVALVLVARRTLFAPEPVTVQVVAAKRGRVEETVTNSKAGTVEARRRAGLSTGTAGIVVALEVERGDRVVRDEVLLRLEDTKQQSELLYAERQLALAQAKHERACLATERALREWTRNRELAQGGGTSIVSEDRLDALHTTYELAAADCRVAEGEVALAAAAVEVARAELDKTVLRAPFDAIVAEVSVELGEWVTPSVPLMAAPDLVDAIDPSSLYVSAPMDEVDAGLLTVGLPARVTVDSHPGRTFAGRIVRVAPYVLDVEQQNRTLEVEVELDDAELSATLLPGTSADVEVILLVREDVLRVPSYALLEGGRLLVVEEELLQERQVSTGIRNWDWTEVTGNLRAGELVVTSLDRPGVEAGIEATIEPTNEEGGDAGGDAP